MCSLLLKDLSFNFIGYLIDDEVNEEVNKGMNDGGND